MSRPSGPVQTPAPGFLSLLNLKNVGQLPDILIGELSPSVNLDKYFLRGQLVNNPASSDLSLAAGNYGTFRQFTTNPIAVPETQWWWVERVSILAYATAAGAVCHDFGVAMQVPGGPNPYGLLSVTTSTTATRTTTIVSASDIWLPPGSRLGVWVGDVATNPVAFVLAGMRYAPLIN